MNGWLPLAFAAALGYFARGAQEDEVAETAREEEKLWTDRAYTAAIAYEDETGKEWEWDQDER